MQRFQPGGMDDSQATSEDFQLQQRRQVVDVVGRIGTAIEDDAPEKIHVASQDRETVHRTLSLGKEGLRTRMKRP